MLKRRIILLSSLLLLSATLCFASGDDEHRQHGSHVHGIGHMNLAVDGNDVYIELENPSANIVGFEHMPSSDNDRHAVHEAAEKLEDGKSLFIFSKYGYMQLVFWEFDDFSEEFPSEFNGFLFKIISKTPIS